MFIPYFVVGYLGRGLIEKIDNWSAIIGLLVIDVVLFLFWKGEYYYISLSMQPLQYTLRTLIGIVTSFLIVLILKKMFKNVSETNILVRFVAYTGTITLGIYLSHNFFFRDILWGWIVEPFPKNNLIVYFIFAMIVFIITSIFITLIGKNKYLSFLLLGNKLQMKNSN